MTDDSDLRFDVRLYETIDDKTVWAISVARYYGDRVRPSFPHDFLAFDMIANSQFPQSVWCIDSIQTMVAVDWLLENGWELDRTSCYLSFLDLLDGPIEEGTG